MQQKSKELEDFNEKYRELLEEHEKVAKRAQFFSKSQNPPLESDYDCVIDITKFTDIAGDGWAINFTNKTINSKEEFLKIKNEFCTSQSFLSITGAYDKGKTYIINRLCNINFPSGKKTETKGISLKSTSIQNNKLIVVDTAGIQSPVNFKVMTLEEKINIEKRLREIVFLLSDLFILVVNDFTILDQKILQKLKRQILENKNKSNKIVIVIHNFKDIDNPQDLEEVWQKQILSTYPPGENVNEHLTNIISNNHQVRWLQTEFTRHLIFVNDNCEFGKSYNDDTLELLKTFILIICVSGAKKNLLDNLFEILNKNFGQSSLEENKSDNIREEGEVLFEKNGVVAVKSEEDNKIYIKCKSISVIKFNPGLNSFEPTYEIFEDLKYRIFIELPGVSEDNLQPNITEHNEFELHGEKKREIEVEGKENFRTFGSFYLNFKIPRNFCNEPDVYEVTDGILRIEFPKKPKLGFRNIKL